MSDGLISIFIESSTTGYTNTDANEVCLLAFESKGDIRTKRWTPFSPFKYPKAKSAFVKTGENISYSRRVARAHYKSDSKMGDKLGNSMYKHIKNKI